jgi:hypothetical protein
MTAQEQLCGSSFLPTNVSAIQGEGAAFTALPIDALGNTVHGVKLSWSSSNTQKVEIDEAGRARFLEPGLAWVTASVGPVTGTAPVLVRPNHRGQSKPTTNGESINGSSGLMARRSGRVNRLKMTVKAMSCR